MVTGANSGIGKATALGLAKLGATVVMICRNPSKGEIAMAEIKAKSGNESVALMIADLSSQQSIRQLTRDFEDKYQHLHVLVNNAGGIFYNRSVTEDGLEYTFALNHLSYFLLTNLLLDLLKASAPARVVNVSTRLRNGVTINFDDLQGEKRYSSIQAYNQSKLANILFTYELARKLENTGITTNVVFPGVVRSNFGKEAPLGFRLLGMVFRPFIASPEKAAEKTIYLARSSEVEGISGKYFVSNKETRSPEQSYDGAVARRLWQISAELTKLS